jgi:hypothetical protein
MLIEKLNGRIFCKLAEGEKLKKLSTYLSQLTI